FAWDDVCDWYVELAKPVLAAGGPAADEAPVAGEQLGQRRPWGAGGPGRPGVDGRLIGGPGGPGGRRRHGSRLTAGPAACGRVGNLLTDTVGVV
ncbi:hypothetical protein ACWDUH_11950, partial [Micromonospora wenchangensis]